MKVGITGATGFVGTVLSRRLIAAGIETYPIVRNSHGLEQEIVVGDLGDPKANEIVLPPLDAVIHLAARAHVMSDKTPVEYRKVNVLGTRRIAEAAALAGVKRFIFLSSIKVNGEFTTHGEPFKETDTPCPEDDYGRSKFEAEALVREIYSMDDRSWTIVRSPLVYGPGVKGNFDLLRKLATARVPLPFGKINNRRSIIFVENLADFLICTLTHNASKNELFLISDNNDLSTGEIVAKIAETSGKPILLLSIPPFGLKILAKLAGRGAMANRLIGSLQIDSAKARSLLEWSPTFGLDEAFKLTIQSDIKA